MILRDAIRLIQHPDISAKENARWVDLGCGSGLFTYALANLLQPESTILAIDKSVVKLNPQPNPNNITIDTKQLDFTKDPLPVDNPDGILMANSLHFVADKMKFIDYAGTKLAAEGIFLIVEYDTDKSNHWVPYPASAYSLQLLFKKAGFHSFTKVGETKSLFNSGNIYAAILKK
jgi:ubiquinone/menaquinone biosynthesis C-methylase UbiE